jgi:exodeoxyribonuclease VIII
MTTTKSQPLAAALVAFNAFMEQFDKGRVKLWGNGADFDNAILVNCFANTNIEPCWKFWNHRCYRTLKSLSGDKSKPKRVGTYHNALDDAITQAVHAMNIWR